MRKQKAITLISLVITIVVLIILASVGIYLSLGNNGIFNRAKEAKELTNKQEATDIINLKITAAQMNEYAERQKMPTLKELSLILKDDSEIEYVSETRKVASAEYDVSSDNPSSIYTKLNEYPYEFEINSDLQLTAINGIKFANGYIKPEGVTEITENGTYDVTNYATANVNVSKSTYKGCFKSSYVDNSSSTNITIDNLTIGKNYFLIIGRAATGGANAELTDFGTSFTNATFQHISSYLYSFIPTSTSIVVSQNKITWGSGYGSQTCAWVFEGELN